MSQINDFEYEQTVMTDAEDIADILIGFNKKKDLNQRNEGLVRIKVKGEFVINLIDRKNPEYIIKLDSS